MDEIDKRIIEVIKEEGGVTNKLTIFIRSFCREGDIALMKRLRRLEKAGKIKLGVKYIGASKHFVISLGDKNGK